MKEAVSDVFKLIEKETGDIITKFEGAVKTLQLLPPFVDLNIPANPV